MNDKSYVSVIGFLSIFTIILLGASIIFGMVGFEYWYIPISLSMVLTTTIMLIALLTN